jgi:hypothetical protein
MIAIADIRALVARRHHAAPIEMVCTVPVYSGTQITDRCVESPEGLSDGAVLARTGHEPNPGASDRDPPEIEARFSGFAARNSAEEPS